MWTQATRCRACQRDSRPNLCAKLAESAPVPVPILTPTPIFAAQTDSFLPSFYLDNSPPRIIKQPPTDELLFKVAQQNKESDKPFIIECEADGQPEPE